MRGKNKLIARLVGAPMAKKILIIEDDQIINKSLFDILKERGYEAFAATSGEEGLAFLKQFPANLVVIDLGLPDMSGLDVLSRVKGDNPSTEAIMLTGNASLESAIEATEMGAFSYLLKPYKTEELMFHIKRALEKQQAHNALIESEDRYRIAIEHSNDGVAIVHGDKHVFANKRFLEIFGYERMEEVVGKPISITAHPDDCERILGYNRGRQKNKSVPSIYEMKGIKKNGETVIIEVSATSILFHGESASLAYLRDITSRKQREKELQENIEKITQAKEEWESLVDSLSELVLLLDERGYIIRSNRGSVSWSLGHPGDARRQTPHNILHPYCTKSDCYLKDFISNALKDTAVGKSAELEVKDEVLKRYLNIRMRPIHTQQNEAFMTNPDTKNNEINRIKGSFAVLVIHDMTERRQAKESLTKAYEELKETQQELIRIEKLALLGKFSSGIAHEIRNPLANIRASAQFCLAQYKLDEEIKKHLGIMLRNSEHANKIIKDLIDLAKPSEVSLKPGDTNDVINKVCDLVKTRFEKQHILLHKKVSRRLPPILMDEERMEKAFLNFVLNALDAMPKGGKLTINAYPYFDKNKVIITIQDTGKGIPQEDLDNIFHPFFTTKRTGIGLGLCLADQVISSHKGRLSVASKTGEGTTITIDLPIARES
ncbi:MAG: hypothetical protein C0392_10435 [Syntrophus sp. (in: bacteria)]|nr:hypothetical protein [Syntrophus sp. (in: bacteria)]